jgi:hypothetical protein
MWFRVDFVWSDVSEERIASIFRVEKSENEENTWAGGCRLSHQSKHQTWSYTGSGPLSATNANIWALADRYKSLSKFAAQCNIPQHSLLNCEELHPAERLLLSSSCNWTVYMALPAMQEPVSSIRNLVTPHDAASGDLFNAEQYRPEIISDTFTCRSMRTHRHTRYAVWNYRMW